MTDYTQTDIGSGYNTVAAINTELTEVETAVNSKADKSGFTMTGDLDLNSNDFLNVGAFDAQALSINGVQVTASGSVTTTLPAQAAHAGKILTTNGTTASWTDTLTISGGTWNSTGIDLASGDIYEINSTSVLSATTLGTGVLSSSLTSLGTIASLVATTADINAGTVDAVIGGTTPAAGSFTTLSATAATVTSLTNSGLTTHSVTAGITAFATGGQASAVELTKDINEISTVATTADSVKLPTAVAGYKITIINNGSNATDVFPSASDNLGAGVDTAASLAAGANITYASYDTTNWESV